MRGNSKTGLGTVFRFNDLAEPIQGGNTPPYFQHCSRQCAYHSTQETVGYNLVDQHLAFPVPVALHDPALEMPDLRIPF